MNIKKIILIALLVIIITIMIFFIGFNNVKNNDKKNEGKLNIVVTSFSTYDFVKHIVGDKANVEFLLGPGNGKLV